MVAEVVTRRGTRRWSPRRPAAAADKKPNVIVFLSDDVGYGEYGFQGNKDIPTPNIDSIAKNGVRFTQGYVAATVLQPDAGPA